MIVRQGDRPPGIAADPVRYVRSLAIAYGTTPHHPSTRADVLVVVKDVVGIVRGLHVPQPVIDGIAVRLADPVGVFVAAEEVDVDTFAEAAEGGEEPPRPSGVPVAEVLAGPPHTIEGDGVR